MDEDYHPAGCWQYHADCAAEKIRQMEKENAALKRERNVLRAALERCAKSPLWLTAQVAVDALDEADKAREGGMKWMK